MHLIEQNPHRARNASSQRCNDAPGTPSTYSKFAHDLTPTTKCRFGKTSDVNRPLTTQGGGLGGKSWLTTSGGQSEIDQ